MPFISVSKLVTIDRHISEEEGRHPQATGEFSSLMHDLTFAVRIVLREVRRAGLTDILGMTDYTNIHGEQVRKLDEYANEILIRQMEHGGHICVMASEEVNGLIHIPDKYRRGKYVLVFDPLDGSANIDVNITIGTIFSLYKRLNPASKEIGGLEDVLQPGYKQVAAGYALYGSSTLLVYTTGHGVNVFTYDPTLGEFLLTFENLKIPKRGNYFSCNIGNYYRWSDNFRQYIEHLKTPSEDGSRPYTLRYIGTGVADIHRTLHYGGIYLYPPDDVMPEGKFRLVYESNALAMIVEQAGGRATDGHRRILEIRPESVHQRVPLFIGSELDVLDAEAFYRGEHISQIGS